MLLSVRGKYWGILLATLILAGGLVFVQLSPFFTFREAELRGPRAQNLSDVTNQWMRGGVNIFRLDRSSLVRTMLARQDIASVSLTMAFPGAIRAEVNHYAPVALVLADSLYGLDCHSRLIPYDSAWEALDLPVITGLVCRRLFTVPDDLRTADVVEGLMQTRQEMPELYRQIAEIDFSDSLCVSIYLTTGAERFTAVSADFASQLAKLDAVRNSVSRSDGGCYDLQYDGVVIRER